MNQTVINALQLLDYFMGEPNELSLHEVYKKTDMSKPTVYRLLSSLEYCGFLTKVKVSDRDIRYRLGLKLLEFGNIVAEQLDLRKIVLPFMKELRDEINEIVHLVVMDGDQATYIEKVESSQTIRLYTRVGKSTPLYAGSGPKLLLAFLPEVHQEKIISKLDLYPLTENTIVDKNQLREELKMIREQGYAISDGEQNLDTIGISYPIRDYTGDVAAALSVSGPSNRFQAKRSLIMDKTKGTADRISRNLGLKE
ncbi:MAG TPA: IclR family transcriptional regulator [Bacillales bacterium]|nr:IclR family transcriptional regulator [Bacillales bacterium]